MVSQCSPDWPGTHYVDQADWLQRLHSEGSTSVCWEVVEAELQASLALVIFSVLCYLKADAFSFPDKKEV